MGHPILEPEAPLIDSIPEDSDLRLLARLLVRAYLADRPEDPAPEKEQTHAPAPVR